VTAPDDEDFRVWRVSPVLLHAAQVFGALVFTLLLGLAALWLQILVLRAVL